MSSPNHSPTSILQYQQPSQTPSTTTIPDLFRIIGIDESNIQRYTNQLREKHHVTKISDLRTLSSEHFEQIGMKKIHLRAILAALLTSTTNAIKSVSPKASTSTLGHFFSSPPSTPSKKKVSLIQNYQHNPKKVAPRVEMAYRIPTCMKSIQVNNDYVYGVTFVGPNITNEIVAVCRSGKINVWNCEQGEQVRDLTSLDHVDVTCCLSIEKFIVTAQAAACISFWNNTSWIMEKQVDLRPLNGIWCLGSNLSQTIILTGHASGAISMVDVTYGTILQSSTNIHSEYVWSIKPHPQQHDIDVYCSCSADRRVVVFNSRFDIQHVFTGHVSVVAGCVWTCIPTRICSAGQDRTLRIWDIEKSTSSQEEQQQQQQDQDMDGIHVKTLDRRPMSVTISSDFTLLAIGLEGGNIALYLSDTLEKMYELDAHSNSVRDIAFHPSEALMVSGSHDGSVKIWSFDVVSG
jgi:WD40 repeat protein